MRTVCAAVGILAVTMQAFGQEPTVELRNDASRAELLLYGLSLKNEKAIPVAFKFPEHASQRPEWMFGTDISHHNGEIDWAKATGAKIRYVYLKATQGEKFYDKTFKGHWGALKVLSANPETKLYRGAYHFLSADGDPIKQANNFVSMIRTAGGMERADLPPVLDLEWDIDAGGDPAKQDRWAAKTPEQIIEKVVTFINVIEKETGRTPIIYTAASWWKTRIGSSKALAKYRLWIADYSAPSALREQPSMVPGHVFDLWQFSETARVLNWKGRRVDANVFKGGDAEFRRAMGIQ